MLHWDNRITQAHLAERLKELSFPKLAVYVVGCVTHAKNVFAASDQRPRSEGIDKAGELLDRFWSEYPHSLQTEVIEPLAVKAADLVPGEEGGATGWEDALIWGVAYSFSLVLSLAKRKKFTKDASGTAIGAVDQAYWAVFSFHHEQGEILRTEQQVRDVEQSSAVCSAEIEFQLSLLATLEEMEHDPPDYTELIEGM